MQNTSKQIERLRKNIEKIVDRKIVHPKDFDFLCKQVEGYVGEHLSISTLKRVWGYVVSNSEISEYSLNVLCRMVGYTGWDEFCNNYGENENNSHKIICRKLFTAALNRGDMLSIIWKHERKITIKYEGQDQFIVLESINSKLQKDDIFHCLQFVDNQPLFISGLYRKGMPPCDYICGRHGGIVWNFIGQEVRQ